MKKESSKEQKNHLTMKLKNPSVLKPSKDSDVSDSDRIKTLENDLLSIIKIITVVSVTDDSDFSEDFLSSYDNYEKMGKVISKNGLYDDYPHDLNYFSSNPVKCWVELLSICFIALNAFPENNLINCDVIGDTTKKESENNAIGICFTALLMIEAFDWKNHTVSLFIPTDSKNEMSTVFMVDGDIRLYS